MPPAFSRSLGGPVHPRADPRLWLILANVDHATSSLDRCPGAPPGNERVGKPGVGKVDGEGSFSAPRARWRHSPIVRAAALVEPSGYLCGAAGRGSSAERRS
jgi:hypothetical protein